MVPDLKDFDLSSVPLFYGYYTLGLIIKFRPDIALVPVRLARFDQWCEYDRDPELLYDIISRHLDKKQTVLVVPFEEYVMGDDFTFSDTLNQFEDAPVYFVTEMDSEQSLYWTFQKRLRCKILELPFILVNDAICYKHIAHIMPDASPRHSTHNFLCMVNRSEPSKYNLLRKILDFKLHEYGLVTYRDRHAPEFVRENFTRNALGVPHQHSLPTINRQEAGQIMLGNLLVSINVANFIQIDNNFDMPLIINAESTVGIFPATEKSIWPALLGRMYLIYGHQHCMQWVSRFCSYGPENFCDISFDDITGYTAQDHDARLERMLSNNTELIKHARDLYHNHRASLEQNRFDFVYNLYGFFRNQINGLSTV